MTGAREKARWAGAIARLTMGATAAWALLGCTGTPGIRRVKAQYSVAKLRTLVIPFSDPAFPYFQSRTGNELADSIVFFMRLHNRRIQAMSGTGLRASVRQRDDSKQPLSDAAKEVGADVVLVGSILDLQTRQPKSPNLMRGKIVVHFALHDADQWEPPLFSRRATYHFPEDVEYTHLLSQDIRPKEVLDHLVSLCGQRIAECFVDHDRAMME